MTFQQVLSTNSDESNWNQVNDLAREVRSKDVVEIFKDDIDATRRVLLGKGADGFYGLKVSPPGVDVYTATDDQLIFNSNQNVFKIVKIITGTFPAVSITGTANTAKYNYNITTIAHGLTYTPVVIGVVTDGAGGYFSLPRVSLSAGVQDMDNSVLSVSSDATNIYLTSAINAYFISALTINVPTYNGKFYLLQETAN